MSRKEWKKTQIDREAINDEVYELIEAELLNYKTNPPHDRYNDSRLVTREIIDNIYKHNINGLIIGLEVCVNSDHACKITIYHDGDYFDPFDDANNCVLLKQLDYEYQFNTKFVATDSGRYRLTLTIDLKPILGA